ncbi:nickel ABC transporter permease subunit NikC [Paenibacillus methanolicus]|uniref:Nickel transport system permease protein n=1 Tax=Paenibacillus methanolicus TaxID=582686 RepID=A0A5S5BT09_9BACL|nr:nickel ABC transporter permease subunit NikC [Paenibacillus methanolicus]TYP70074.1 nickel transport system permease protein [Paenibacillus methanolicus]
MIASIRTGLKSQKTAAICAVVLAILFLLSILAPWIAPHDPIHVNLALKLQSPSWDYPLGTDHLGRCNLSRLLYGSRISLGFASVIFISSLLIGLVIGTFSGYRGGITDQVLMRFSEGVMAFPSLVLVLGLVGIFGPGLPQVILAMVMVQWVYYARMFRGMVLSLREKNFIAAARISGSSQWTIIRRHMIPNVLPPIVVMGTLEIGWAIMDIAALSFLGLGIQPPSPEWGSMIHEGKSYIRSNPELMLYPGMMILIIVMTFNILGEALSEHFGVQRRYGKDGAR